MSGDFEYQWGGLVARVWADQAFRAKLVADPAAVLKDNGLLVPAGVTVKVVENTDTLFHLTIPLKPAPEELSEEDLNRVAGGYCGVANCGAHCGCERGHD